MDLWRMSAFEAAAAIRAGEISSGELVQAHIERIKSLEESVGAWAYFDEDYALHQAQKAQDARQAGQPLGPLHGVPIGIKDIIDTENVPTEYGTPLYSGRIPGDDATVVALLRAAGAIIMGKTVTTELAVYSPGKTTNPHDAGRTPGGSSSGSAAAVATQMVPLALGSQTNGSIIRPASYCGVYGYKPSHGLISRFRVLEQSRRLDTVGVFGNSLEDVALLSEPLMAYDAKDPDMRPRARPQLQRILAEDPPMPPVLAFIKTPQWDQADDDTQGAFTEVVEHLGEHVEEVELPPIFEHSINWHRTIMEGDLARSFETEYKRGKDSLSPVLREMIERGQTYRAYDYNVAVEMIDVLNSVVDDVLERYDAIITPATTGEAPVGLDSTGSPIFCTIWSLCRIPTISLPLLQGSNGMPMGIQMITGRGDDARLLRIARWLKQFVAA